MDCCIILYDVSYRLTRVVVGMFMVQSVRLYRTVSQDQVDNVAGLPGCILL